MKERFKYLLRKSDQNQKVVLDIGISLLPKRYALSGVKTRLPKWRTLQKSIEPIKDGDIRYSNKEAKKVLIGMDKYDFEEIQLLLENMIELGEEHLVRLVEVVENWIDVEKK